MTFDPGSRMRECSPVGGGRLSCMASVICAGMWGAFGLGPSMAGRRGIFRGRCFGGVGGCASAAVSEAAEWIAMYSWGPGRPLAVYG